MSRRYTFFLSFLTLTVGLLGACNSNNSPETTAEDEARNTAGNGNSIRISRAQMDESAMEFSPFIQQEVVNKIEAPGFVRVLPQYQVRVTSITGGHVRKVYVREGQWVRQGAPLFMLENPNIIEMQQVYLENQATIASLKSDYERQSELAKEDIASEKTLLKAQSDYRSALARVNGLKSRLEMLGINIDQVEEANFVSSIIVHSPIEGGVATMGITRGMYLSPETEAVEVVNPNKVYLELSIFERDVLRLTEGERVRFRLGDGAWLGGSVLYIGQKVKGDSRTVSVQVQMDKLSENILPGMFVEAEIILEGVVTSTLPAEAVAEFNGKKYALMKENQDGQSYTLKRVEVIPELTGDGFLTIVNAADFPKGSLFLSSGVEKLISE